MPVNTLATAGGPMDWFNAIPKLTRTYGVLTVVCAAMISWKLPQVPYLILDWREVITHFQVRTALRWPSLFTKSSIPRMTRSLHFLSFFSCRYAVWNLLSGTHQPEWSVASHAWGVRFSLEADFLSQRLRMFNSYQLRTAQNWTSILYGHIFFQILDDASSESARVSFSMVLAL